MARIDMGKLTDALIRYLDCPCRFFNSMRNDDPLMEAFSEAQQRGKRDGFTPVIVVVDDTLIESITDKATGTTALYPELDIDIDAVRSYRQETLAMPLLSGEEELEDLYRMQREAVESDGFDCGFDGVIVEDCEEPEERFYGYWDYTGRKTHPLIIAEIPTDKPWEIFAWLPFGGWNECPDTPVLMAAAKHWYERYGAVPAVLTSDTLDFELSAPVEPKDAMQLAREHFGFCPDIIVSASEEVDAGTVAASLTRSSYWFFWWD